MKNLLGLLMCLSLSVLAGCAGVGPSDGNGNANGNDEMDDGPIAEGISAKLGDPMPSLTDEQLATFERGLAVLQKRFDLADGLGPVFNVTFCGACHERPAPGGGSAAYRNFFLTGVETADGAFVPGTSEGKSGGVLRIFNYNPDIPLRPRVPEETNVFTQRNAIPMFGVGLIAELSEEVLLANADPDDADGDGVSGRPNFDRGFVGRFGRKAQTVSIEGFIRGPLFNHLGITTDPLTEAQRRNLPVDSSRTGKFAAKVLQAAAEDAPNSDEDAASDPEMSSDDLFDLVSFSMMLAAPKFEEPTEQSNRGRLTFHEVGCSDCHVPRLEGPRGPVPAYSDFLLHDMGEALDDGIRQGEATGAEFKTQPLWGVSAVGPYLHDGRSDTLEEAILAHGGEAKTARDKFDALTDSQKADVIEFLMSLGGRDQMSEGLVKPGEPISAVGEYGGPFRTLTAEEQERFIRGRKVFDQDFGLDEGVGGLVGADGAPRFNGDSCRACHFDPVIGGAGPRGVNVMRHCAIDEDGNFIAPSTTANTILHREVRVGATLPAEPTPEINFFEMRQTPHVFGGGLMDAISEDAILANADPDDENGDGISGRPDVIPNDGRIGRFGWKADVPSLAEFIRDGMGAELGITLPEQEGLTFGITSDSDGIPDPELSLADIEDLTFFMSLLAGPPRQPIPDGMADMVAAGQDLFDSVGCTKCHVPALVSPLGDVPLYSDLLLHDILPPLARGIESADASQTEFRTAPLWGLSKTNPYFHNGAADTIDEAIRMHDGEALSIRQAYEGLSDADRAALLTFLSTL